MNSDSPGTGGWRSRRAPAPLVALAAFVALVVVVAAAAGLWLRGRSDGMKARGSAEMTMNESTHRASRAPNRLIHEKSPYLLQHAYNPVNWFPWGEEAFEKARRENRPIFLSIGYSTCHWCHVMERESFEDDSVAALLNRDFVAIKVDREERPDVDRIYMTSMQAMGMGGGWPLNAFLTPDLKPFYGGTYFPRQSMQGRIGMMELLPRIHEAWLTQRESIEQTGSQVFEAIAASAAPAAGDVARDALIRSCADSLAASYDVARGGFGSAPKFPSTVNLDFLWRWWAMDPAARVQAREMAMRQLDAMRQGGVHDQLGGGFHRYSTDAEWLVPHFEKMLYDQAQIASAYVDGYLATGRAEYAATARDVFAYVTRDLSASEGGFYSAEDADSEGEEGKFYVWTPAEIETALPVGEGALFCEAYGVTSAGNFEHGASILHLARPLAEVAARHHLEPADFERRLADARAKLLAARAKRVRPHRDDKVLAAWNGLMISAFARGARALDDPALAARARAAADFVWNHLRDRSTGALHRRWREGEAAGAGQLDDYADVALGYLDLYQATFESVWLERAVEITTQMMTRFYDEKAGGFFETPEGDASIRLRLKDEYDGAEVAGGSVAAEVLERLAVLLDRGPWRAGASATFDFYARKLRGHAHAMPRMVAAMLLEAAGARHVVIAGDPAAADTRALIREFNRRFLPEDVLLVTAPGARAQALRSLAPFAASLLERGGRATAYVCVNYACRLPTTDPVSFAAQLDERPALVKEVRR